MKKLELLGATAIALLVANPAYAQTAPQADDTTAEEGIGDIVVTAQRQSESLQSVPIAVSAFSGEALEKQQIKNASDLQLTLPNVTFSKGNFTGSSFTIRGIGDLCVGTSCDSATAIHVNGTPLLATRLFETEYFDLERVEVLRGPQGTLFGRNATSGVVNFLTARPDLSGIHASGEAEYGNFNAYKFKGMFNLPIGETLGVRVAGFYQKRDGYTTNVFNNSNIDNRDMYAVRGSIRWQPSDTTTVDLMGYYFREKDNRARIQKQQCQRDPTGVLGCLNGRRDFGVLNANSTFVGVLTSREFLAVNGIPSAFGLGSLYGPDAYATFTNPANVRQVNTDFTPEYFTSEQQYQARLEQEFGSMKLQLTGFYHKTNVDSRQDYNQSVQNRAIYAAGLGTLQAAAAGLIPGLPSSYFAPIAAAVIPNGAAGNLCTSNTSDSPNTGSYGGNRICAATPQDFDRSNVKTRDYSIEGIFSSDFDGKFNFLLGGIYVNAKSRDNNYYINSFGIDYLTGILGTFNALGRAGLAAIPGAQIPPAGFLGTPYYQNNTPRFDLESYGLFGEAYIDISDRLKLTGGLRYNHDKKFVSAHTTLANFLTPFGSTNVFSSPFRYGYAVTGAPLASRLQPFDADPKTACSITSTTTSGILTAANVTGCEDFQNRSVTFSELTGRAVLDFQIDPNHLLYASYSRGYKSGGINPPLSPVFAVSDSFDPEFVNAFEIGSKNTFAGGAMRFNLTAFYYQYKALQLSRIVARTSVNDNVDANIYGLEAEAIIKPSREWLFNIGASYLHTKVSSDKFHGNPRDPSGGRSDSVVIKDITNGSNCAVVPTVAGNTVGVNTLVTAINGSLGLQGPVAFPSDGGIAGTGAFGICSAIAGAIASPSAGLRALFATPTGALAFTVENAGVPVNIKGNKLPQAPNYKFSIGAQYTAEFSNGMTLVPRADLTYTGDSYGNIFNGNVNKVKGYSQVNAQIQLNGNDDRWFARAWIQNVFDNNATTGLYVTDQSSGLFTNIFTLEPRRYGITAGFKF
ncbi:MAG: TonB-dependent receptor [Sphingomonadales bacterium]|nr:TonB-dependent receptor [Sphingomonadales bacterium]MBK8273294.1 TonB-dependent receptor [Sphingomonadales bacterium]